MAHYFLDARIEEGRGDHVAVIDDDGRYTYRQVQALANQVGNALSAMGVGVEDRVLIGLSDGVEFAAAFFGVLKIGAVVDHGEPRAARRRLRALPRLHAGARARRRQCV